MKTNVISTKTAILAAAAAAVIGMALAAPSLFAEEKKAGETTNVVGNIDKDAFGTMVRDYLLENPKVVIEALEKYQDIQKAEEEAGFKEAIKKNKDKLHSGEVAGNPDGDVVITEFFDYNCGYCKRAVPDIQQVLQNDKNVKVVFKDLPILSESSHEISRWAIAAGRQGKYWEYHQALMNDHGPKDAAALEKMAADLGLDVEKMKKDADSKEVRTEIEENMALSRELGVQGTPAFVINDIFAPGYMGYEGMKEAVDQARSAEGG